MAKENESDDMEGGGEVIIETDKLIPYLDAKGRLTGLEEINPTLWPKGWKEVDPNLGRRYMLKIQGFTEEEYQKKEAKICERVKQREGEDDESFELRKRLYLHRIDSMWKPGQSGNPAGKPENYRYLQRAKKMPMTVKVALERQLSEQVKMVMPTLDGEKSILVTKKELIAKNIVDMVALGRVEFPTGKSGRRRIVELGGRDWAANALKLLKMINPKPMEETEEVIQTISFDIDGMMPTNAKMTVVKKITGRDYDSEEEYLDDEEAVDQIIDAAGEDADIDISEVLEDEEDEVKDDADEWIE